MPSDVDMLARLKEMGTVSFSMDFEVPSRYIDSALWAVRRIAELEQQLAAANQAREQSDRLQAHLGRLARERWDKVTELETEIAALGPAARAYQDSLEKLAAEKNRAAGLEGLASLRTEEVIDLTARLAQATTERDALAAELALYKPTPKVETGGTL